MKTLQNNFTTPEQSKRLLELGVPADSADCCYPETHLGERVKTADYVHVLGGGERILGDKAIPCWSVGRLIEIYVIVRGLDTAYLPIERGEDMVKYLIQLYEEKVKDFDFSKLEE